MGILPMGGGTAVPSVVVVPLLVVSGVVVVEGKGAFVVEGVVALVVLVVGVVVVEWVVVVVVLLLVQPHAVIMDAIRMKTATKIPAFFIFSLLIFGIRCYYLPK